MTPSFDIWEQFVSVYLAAQGQHISNDELTRCAGVLRAGGSYTFFGAVVFDLTAEQLRQWIIAKANTLRVK